MAQRCLEIEAANIVVEVRITVKTKKGQQVLGMTDRETKAYIYIHIYTSIYIYIIYNELYTVTETSFVPYPCLLQR